MEPAGARPSSLVALVEAASASAGGLGLACELLRPFADVPDAKANPERLASRLRIPVLRLLELAAKGGHADAYARAAALWEAASGSSHASLVGADSASLEAFLGLLEEQGGSRAHPSGDAGPPLPDARAAVTAAAARGTWVTAAARASMERLGLGGGGGTRRRVAGSWEAAEAALLDATAVAAEADGAGRDGSAARVPAAALAGVWRAVGAAAESTADAVAMAAEAGVPVPPPPELCRAAEILGRVPVSGRRRSYALAASLAAASGGVGAHRTAWAVLGALGLADLVSHGASGAAVPRAAQRRAARRMREFVSGDVTPALFAEAVSSLRVLGVARPAQVRAVWGAFREAGVSVTGARGAPLLQLLLSAEAARDPALAFAAVRAALCGADGVLAPHHTASVHRCLLLAGDVRGGLAWAVSTVVAEAGVGLGARRRMLRDVQEACDALNGATPGTGALALVSKLAQARLAELADDG